LDSLDYHAGHAGDAAGATSSAGQPVGTIAQLANYLTNGYWGGSSHKWAGSVTVNIDDLNVAERALATSALIAYREVSGFSFSFTSGAANITFLNNGSGQAVTSSSWSGGSLTSATITISSDWWPNTNINGYMYQTYLHELGHALGLGHQGNYNGSATYGVQNVYANDTWQYSVMSYFSQHNYGGSTDAYVITPQMADIYAVQSLYGANNTTRTGDTTYGFGSTAGSIYDFGQYSGTPAMTIYDSGGNDWLNASAYSMTQTINLASGAWSSIGGEINNIGIYLTSTVENAIGGSGVDYVYGNAAANSLYGGAGADQLYGYDGNDWFSGGAGSEYIDGGLGTDTAYFSGYFADYSRIRNSDGSWSVVDLRSGSPDGTDWVRSIESFQFADRNFSTVVNNTAPVATINDQAVHTNQWVKVQNFLSVTDANSDSISQYQFYDSGSGSSSGYFWTPQNSHHAADTYINVAAADIGSTWIRGGQTAGTEPMWVRAFDGTDWSAWDRFEFTTLPNTAPQAAIGNQSVGANQWARVQPWLSVTDADGDAITQYQFYDAGGAASSGYFWTPQNSHHAADSYINVAAADIGSTWVRGGQGAGTETMWVRAFDGTAWSAWDAFSLVTV
jgi:hypothetical protein